MALATPVRVKPDPEAASFKSLQEFIDINLLHDGTTSSVSRATHEPTGKVVILKHLDAKKRIGRESRYIRNCHVRERNISHENRHKNMVQVLGIFAEGESQYRGDFYIVLEHASIDMATLQDAFEIKWPHDHVKCLFHQLLEGMEYLCNSMVVHRDIKLDNLLLFDDGTLKISDFGSARKEGGPAWTPGAVTLWNRAPEILLGALYDYPVDWWAAGTVLLELLFGYCPWEGRSEMDQLALIFDALGKPSEDELASLKNFGCQGIELLRAKESKYGGFVEFLRSRSTLNHTAQDYLSFFLCWRQDKRVCPTLALGKYFERNDDPENRALAKTFFGSMQVETTKVEVAETLKTALNPTNGGSVGVENVPGAETRTQIRPTTSPNGERRKRRRA